MVNASPCFKQVHVSEVHGVEQLCHVMLSSLSGAGLLSIMSGINLSSLYIPTSFSTLPAIMPGGGGGGGGGGRSLL